MPDTSHWFRVQIDNPVTGKPDLYHFADFQSVTQSLAITYRKCAVKGVLLRFPVPADREIDTWDYWHIMEGDAHVGTVAEMSVPKLMTEATHF
jgi:hypothetical protein